MATDPGDRRLVELMTVYAEPIVSSTNTTYDLAIQLFTKLSVTKTPSRQLNNAVMLWGSLTDADDDPPQWAHGVQESAALMRRAAAEWLALGPSPSAVDDYFSRWLDWPQRLDGDAARPW